MSGEKSIAIQQTGQRETSKTGPCLPEKLSPVTATVRFFFYEIRHRPEIETVLLQLQVKPRLIHIELKRCGFKYRNSRTVLSPKGIPSLTHIQSM